MGLRRRSKSALAAHLGVALSTVSRWRVAMPKADTIQKTADWLGVDAKWLMTGEALKKPSDADGSPVVRDESYGSPNDYRSQSAQFSETERMMELLSRIADALETIADRLPPPAMLSEALGETRKQA